MLLDRGRSSTRPSPAVALIVAFQALLGILILLFVTRGARLEYIEYSTEAVHDPGRAVGTVIMLLIGLLWIAISIGMFKLRDWSRWLTLILVSVALLAGSLSMIFYKRQPGFDFTPALIRFSLWLSVPMSTWWWIVLSLPGVREQFH